jgi:hypothetical protein
MKETCVTAATTVAENAQVNSKISKQSCRANKRNFLRTSYSTTTQRTPLTSKSHLLVRVAVRSITNQDHPQPQFPARKAVAQQAYVCTSVNAGQTSRTSLISRTPIPRRMLIKRQKTKLLESVRNVAALRIGRQKMMLLICAIAGPDRVRIDLTAIGSLRGSQGCERSSYRQSKKHNYMIYALKTCFYASKTRSWLSGSG